MHSESPARQLLRDGAGAGARAAPRRVCAAARFAGPAAFRRRVRGRTAGTRAGAPGGGRRHHCGRRGCGRSPQDPVLVLNAVPRCSAVAIAGRWTASGQTLFGRDYDYFPSFRRFSQVWRTYPNGVPASLGCSDIFSRPLGRGERGRPGRGCRVRRRARREARSHDAPGGAGDPGPLSRRAEGRRVPGGHPPRAVRQSARGRRRRAHRRFRGQPGPRDHDTCPRRSCGHQQPLSVPGNDRR